MNLPFIVTSSVLQGPYINNDVLSMAHPTTDFMSFWDCLNDMIIKPVQFGLKLRHPLFEQKKVSEDLGIVPEFLPDAKWKDSQILRLFLIKQGL
jgi:hypothetical protein